MLAEIFQPDFICHGPPAMNHSHDRGPEPIERCIFGGAFEDLVFSVGDIEFQGERLVGHFEATGKQIAEFQGVAPADEAKTVEGTTIFTIRDGKLAEGWGALAWR